MRFVFYCTILTFLSSGFLTAQVIIKGKVFDLNTLEPLQGVYVIFEKNKGTSTDSEGSYSIESDSLNINVTFQLVGYKTAERSVRPGTDEVNELNVGLEMEIREIGQIVISSARSEERITELTVSMDVIRSGDFLKTHITDAQELVNKTPGIEVLDGQASIRGGSGFSYGVGSRVLALIDGLPVLSPDAGNIKWQFLPLENISQIEIIKGATSVLYGSSALNGIINFRTADASEKPSTRFFAETGIYDKPKNKNWLWWDTPRIFSNISFSHLQKFGRTDVGIGINLLGDNGYRKYNDEKLGRLSLRIKHVHATVRGLAYGLNLNSGYTSKTDFVLWEDAEFGALKQDTSSVSYLHGSFFALDPYISLNKEGPFRHDLRIRLQTTGNKFPVRDNNNSNAYSSYADYQLKYKISDFINLTSGLSATYTKVFSNFYGDHLGVNIAGFSQVEAHPFPRLKLVAGLRIEQNYLDRQNDKIVPIFRTGVNWQAADHTFLRASFGQGYRYPSIAEKHAATTLGSVRIFPNPFVEPESGWSSEAGIKQEIMSGQIKGLIDLSVFLSQSSGLIEYIFSNYPDPVTGIFDFGFQATNVEQSRVYGYELEFALKRETSILNTTLSGGYTYIYPVEFNNMTNKVTDIFLKYRRKHSAKISLNNSYRKFDLGITLFLKSRILNIDDVFVNEFTRESILPGFYGYWLENNKGYFLLDSNLGYNFKKNFSLSFAVKNITNTEYMGRPGDIQPQRNFSLRLSGNF